MDDKLKVISTQSWEVPAFREEEHGKTAAILQMQRICVMFASQQLHDAMSGTLMSWKIELPAITLPEDALSYRGPFPANPYQDLFGTEWFPLLGAGVSSKDQIEQAQNAATLRNVRATLRGVVAFVERKKRAVEVDEEAEGSRPKKMSGPPTTSGNIGPSIPSNSTSSHCDPSTSSNSGPSNSGSSTSAKSNPTKPAITGGKKKKGKTGQHQWYAEPPSEHEKVLMEYGRAYTGRVMTSTTPAAKESKREFLNALMEDLESGKFVPVAMRAEDVVLVEAEKAFWRASRRLAKERKAAAGEGGEDGEEE